MSVLKTLSAASCLLLLCAPVHADTGLADDATVCAGRLSAHLEHQWLMQNPAADRTEAARDAMVALLEAVGDVDDAATLALRIEAKHAHAALLQRATFGRLRNGAEAGRRADGLLAVAGSMREDMVALGMDGAKIRVHRTGVDLDRFAPRDRAAAKAAPVERVRAIAVLVRIFILVFLLLNLTQSRRSPTKSFTNPKLKVLQKDFT